MGDPNAPFGSVCLRTDGQIVWKDEKGFSVRSAGKEGMLTLVIVGAYRPRSRFVKIDRQDTSKLAEDRRVAITPEGFALDVREEPPKSRKNWSCPWQPLRLLFGN